MIQSFVIKQEKETEKRSNQLEPSQELRSLKKDLTLESAPLTGFLALERGSDQDIRGTFRWLTH